MIKYLTAYLFDQLTEVKYFKEMKGSNCLQVKQEAYL